MSLINCFYLLAIALGLCFFIMELWIRYLAVMNLKRTKDSNALTSVGGFLGLYVYYSGLFMDFVGNLFLSLPMLEFPQEWLITSRLKRHCDANNWRGGIARWMATHLLDPFDPSGKHV